MDRGYVDFGRLHGLHLAGAFFITRAKSNMDSHRVYSAAADSAAGIICDQTIALGGHYTAKSYPEHLRRIRFRDPETAKTLIFVTNQFGLQAASDTNGHLMRRTRPSRLKGSIRTETASIAKRSLNLSHKQISRR